MPLHAILENDTDAFWATCNFFEILRRYYGPVIDLRNKLYTEDSEKVVRLYCATCRCKGGRVTDEWAARAREFVHWRILAVVGLSLVNDIKSAIVLCRFFLKYVKNPRRFRKCLCALSYCVLAGLYGRCTKTTCNCMRDCTFYEKLNKRQVKAVLKNVEFMSTLF